MSPSQANFRKHLQQSIDAEIRALRLRRNALSPISSLPPEIFAAIFSLLCLPALEGEMSDHHQAQLLVSHVCHEWREIALNQPLLWSNVDFITLSAAGATEILARAKSVPLYLDARFPHRRWDDIQFGTFRKELQARVPYVCHISINAKLLHLHKILGGLVSPAPTLEYLSLFSCEGYQKNGRGGRLFVSNTLFNGSAPRLSCLKLFQYKISWNTLLLKGLRHLEIRSPIARPKLATWLDALDAMTQLKMLVLHSASPIAASQDNVRVKHNVTLPSLTHLNILTSPANCALILAHLDLPALTALSVTVYLRSPDSNHIEALLPRLTRHSHGPQDTRPLQSVLICNGRKHAKILAWTLPDIDAKVQDPPTFLAKTTLPSPRVALFFTSEHSFFITTNVDVLDAAMAALPLSGLVTLVAHDLLDPPDTHFWLDHALKWSLLRRAHLTVCAQQGFNNMLRNGNNERPPLLPLLEEITLVGYLLYEWTSTLRKRAEQGVPLERIDLRFLEIRGPREPPWISIIRTIVVDTLVPDNTPEMRERMESRWKTVFSAPFSETINFEAEFKSYTDDGGERRR
jgi:hypothetical protein